jgi:hypothetical protein
VAQLLAPYAIPALVAVFGVWILVRGEYRPDAVLLSLTSKRLQGAPARLVGVLLLLPLALTVAASEPLADAVGLSTAADWERKTQASAAGSAGDLPGAERTRAGLDDMLKQTERMIKDVKAVRDNTAALEKLLGQAAARGLDLPRSKNWQEIIDLLNVTNEKTRRQLRGLEDSRNLARQQWAQLLQERARTREHLERQDALNVGLVLSAVALLLGNILCLAAGRLPASPAPSPTPGPGGPPTQPPTPEGPAEQV